MTRSILSRFALLSGVAFAIALCGSLALSYWRSSNDIIQSYYGLADYTAAEVQGRLSQTTCDEVFSDDTSASYKKLRAELRELCATFAYEYLYLYEVDSSAGTRTQLISIAKANEEDAMLREQRPLGSTTSESLLTQELDADRGNENATSKITNDAHGVHLSWYFPIYLKDYKEPLVMCIVYDAMDEQQAVFDYSLSFVLPLVVAIALTLTFELIVLKKSVSDPLRAIASRMRSFTQDNVRDHEHIAIGRMTEMVDIETSFNQMTDDIQRYVEHIEKMSEEHAKEAAELEVARRIQLGLVPPQTQCAGDGFEAFALERTALAVGGDFYNLIELHDGKLMCVIGDVSGKGVSAALFMAMFRTLLYDNLQRNEDPARTLNEVNDIVTSHNPECMFVTLVAAVYDPTTRVLTYANAGHTPPLLTNGAYLSPNPGIALGLFEDVGIENETLVLKPGEGILLYTDGTTEAINHDDEFFGEQRLAQAASDKRDAQSTVRAVVDAVDAFAGDREQFDDLTLLSLFASEGSQRSWRATLEPDGSSFAEVVEHIQELCGKGQKTMQAILACDECFGNVVQYSGAMFVEVELRATEGELMVRIVDDGTPFDPLAYEPEERSFEDFDEGGMGIMLIRSISKSATYEYTDDKNVLTMRFEM